MNFLSKLKQPEGRKLEFKREMPAKSDILKTIIGFANGAGGELVIGVSDSNREIVGVEDPLLLEEKISNMVFDNIQPFVSPYISVITIEGKSIVIVNVLPGYERPYFKKSEGPEKGVYIRVGSSNRRATSDMAEELRRLGRGIVFESEVDISKSINDLDKSSLTSFFETIGQSGYDKSVLQKWKVLQRNNGDYFPTVAGLVLFGKRDLSDYDFASIRLSIFQGKTLDAIAETREFGVPIIEKVDAVYREINQFLRKESYLEGARRLEKTIIPAFAVREVVVNAIVHRDYSMTGASIKVNVFDDRLEVISPGVLSGNLDLSDIGTGISECRNRSIVRIFRKMDYMEELGTGIARIIKLYEDKKLSPPSFFEHGQYFKAVLPQYYESDNNQDRVLHYLKAVSEASASRIAENLDIHHNTVLKNLNHLIKQGKAEKTGIGKNTRYKPL